MNAMAFIQDYITKTHGEKKTNLNEIHPLYDKSLLSINTT